MNLHILYEDEALAVVEKPQGMPAQPDKTGDMDVLTLLSEQCNHSFVLVHRLDRPVGGVMLFAKSTQAEMKAAVSKGLQIGGWKKSYLTVVDGHMRTSSGTLENYLWKDGRSNTSKVVSEGQPGGKKAVLHYKVLGESFGEHGEVVSLLKVELETGRHHQIRVQMAANGTPILGDRKYNQKPSGKYVPLALWSYQIDGVLPTTKKPFMVQCLPKEGAFSYFDEVLRNL